MCTCSFGGKGVLRRRGVSGAAQGCRGDSACKREQLERRVLKAEVKSGSSDEQIFQYKTKGLSLGPLTKKNYEKVPWLGLRTHLCVSLPETEQSNTVLGASGRFGFHLYNQDSLSLLE